MFQGFIPRFLGITHYNKPGTHCPCLQTGVGAEHSLLLLQPEEELFLETFPNKTKIPHPLPHLDVIKITSDISIIPNLCQRISHYDDHSVLSEESTLNPCNRDIFVKLYHRLAEVQNILYCWNSLEICTLVF